VYILEYIIIEKTLFFENKSEICKRFYLLLRSLLVNRFLIFEQIIMHYHIYKINKEFNSTLKEEQYTQ
jgi:hypothetical protein